MTTIYFVRHAHSTYTKEERERPLSEKGHCDAENVTHLLKDKHIDVVISSPYKEQSKLYKELRIHINYQYKQKKICVKDY